MENPKPQIKQNNNHSNSIEN